MSGRRSRISKKSVLVVLTVAFVATLISVTIFLPRLFYSIPQANFAAPTVIFYDWTSLDRLALKFQNVGGESTYFTGFLLDDVKQSNVTGTCPIGGGELEPVAICEVTITVAGVSVITGVHYNLRFMYTTANGSNVGAWEFIAGQRGCNGPCTTT
jgi:hypothetical protein